MATTTTDFKLSETQKRIIQKMREQDGCFKRNNETLCYYVVGWGRSLKFETAIALQKNGLIKAKEIGSKVTVYELTDLGKTIDITIQL